MMLPHIKSITTRLTLFYSLAAFMLLVFVVLFSYWEMTSIFKKADNQFLMDEMDTLASILRNKPNDFVALRQEVDEVPRTVNEIVYFYYLRILDQNNQMLIETDGMKKVFEKAKFFNLNATLHSKQIQWWTSPSGNDYLLIQSKLETKTQTYTIQAALDISYQNKEVGEYRKKLTIVLLIGLIVAFFVGFLIARRGMRSLYKLTEAAEKITATSLNRRIDPGAWPVELSTLGIAFNRMLDRIEESFSRLTQFSSDLAHELRTPVNNLIGETEIALTNPILPLEHRALLESNIEELHRISHIIENILFLSYAENPQLEISKGMLDVRKELKVICDFYQASADEKNITVICHGSATLHANQIMFRRMLSNLLSNALKYTSTGGMITIDLMEIEPAIVQISMKDNGVGIAEKNIPKIFNRFYRADIARSQCPRGIGLGLAIVKSIVELHQGSISVTSQLHRGTEILVMLPK